MTNEPEHKYFFPICNVELKPHSRYPSYVCGSCKSKATDIDGRPLSFSNIDLSGAFRQDTAIEVRCTTVIFVTSQV